MLDCLKRRRTAATSFQLQTYSTENLWFVFTNFPLCSFFFFPLVEDIFANAHSHLGRNLCRYTFNKWVSSKTDGTLLSARDLNRLSKFSAFQHNLFYFQARKDFFSPVSRIKCWQINVSAKHWCAHICRLSFNIRNRDTTRYSGQFPALLVATKAYFFIKKPQVF